VGFRVVECLARRARIELDQSRFGARTGRGCLAGHDTVLMLPQTYMNASGGAVAQAVEALALEDVAADLLLVLDDADLPLGRLRLRARGGDGGHRGLADVLARLGVRQVPRLRFGIGRPQQVMETADFVLQEFGAEERPLVDQAVERAADAVESTLGEGVVAAMNRYNADPAPEPGDPSDPDPSG
jgi:PTH1 family peptidyl-tRNA hydrolase